MEINVWTSEGKQLVPISNCLSVTATRTDFHVKCKDGVQGEINLDTFNAILEINPAIVDKKALELKETRDILKALFGDE